MKARQEERGISLVGGPGQVCGSLEAIEHIFSRHRHGDLFVGRPAALFSQALAALRDEAIEVLDAVP